MLKTFIENSVKGINVILSKPILRIDIPKARITLDQLCRKLENLNIKTLDNSNIADIHLGRKGLHLNGRGNGRLALNWLIVINEIFSISRNHLKNYFIGCNIFYYLRDEETTYYLFVM